MNGAHDARALERSYYRRVQVSILAALAIHATAIVLVPPYVPRPYRLSQPPLRLVSAGFGGGGGTGVPSATSGPADRARPSSMAPLPVSPQAIVTEQFRVSSRAEPATSIPALSRGETGSRDARGVAGGGDGGGGGGAAGEGAGDEAPPVFYEFDSPPRVLRSVVPEYPAIAKLREAEGTVVLNANVDERGRVIRVWVAQATATEALIQAAVDAMYRFQFSPGSQQGVPVKCTVAVPFNFRLNLHL